jgi:putative SOS response-associated peptidase YedK
VEPFAFAGLWESWKGPEGPLETCAIITTSANALLAPIHDRMPVMLGPDDHGRWLDASRPGAEELLRPCPEEWLETAPASTRVNNPRNDDPSVLEAEA